MDHRSAVSKGGIGRRLGRIAALVLCLAAGSSIAAESVFQSLTERGVALEETATQRLPPPTLPDGLGPAATQQALRQIADESHPLDQLLRKSVVAPFVLKITDQKPVAGALPRRVDLWFAAYGDLRLMSDEDFLKGQLSSNNPNGDQAAFLTDQELAARQIQPERGERYLAATVTLFDRVRISGVMRTQLIRSEESITAAGMIDPRFDHDPRFPNTWRSLTRDDNGNLQVGPPHVYHSAGWYCKATKLAEPAGAVLVEVHVLFDEPHGWFNGTNLLRSKLPIVVQDGVRKFRRRLESAGKP